MLANTNIINQWEIPPAYGICPNYRPDSFWVNYHALSIGGKRKDITKQDLLSLSKEMNIKKSDKIITEVNITFQNWES